MSPQDDAGGHGDPTRQGISICYEGSERLEMKSLGGNLGSISDLEDSAGANKLFFTNGLEGWLSGLKHRS
jgi:hypothetical protein